MRKRLLDYCEMGKKRRHKQNVCIMYLILKLIVMKVLTSVRKYRRKLCGIDVFRMRSMTQIIVDVILIVNERLYGIEWHAAMMMMTTMIRMVMVLVMMMIICTGSVCIVAQIVDVII